MKKTITIALLASLMVSCGKDAKLSPSIGTTATQDNYRLACDPSSTLTGNYEDSESNLLDLSFDCHGITYDTCDLRFTYHRPYNGVIVLNVEQTNGGTCLALGEHVCSITHYMPVTDSEYLSIKCGEKISVYFPKEKEIVRSNGGGWGGSSN